MVDPNSIKEEFPMMEPTEWKEEIFGSEKPPHFVKINDSTWMQIENVMPVYTGQFIEVYYPTYEKKPEIYYKARTRWIPTSMYLALVDAEIVQNNLTSGAETKEIKENLDTVMLALADIYEMISRKEGS